MVSVPRRCLAAGIEPVLGVGAGVAAVGEVSGAVLRASAAGAGAGAGMPLAAALACASISFAFLVSSTTVASILGSAGMAAFGFSAASSSCHSSLKMMLCLPIRMLSLSLSGCLPTRWLLT